MENTNSISKSDFSPQHMVALWYANNGTSVIPISPRYETTYLSEPTTDPSLICSCWSRHPEANVAIVLKDLLVIEVHRGRVWDGIKALKNLEAEYGPLPLTRMQLTPSGMHYIYRTNAIIVPSRYSFPAPGINIKGHNERIVVEPSVVNGKPVVMSKADIADAPLWLVTMVMAPKTENDTDTNPFFGARIRWKRLPQGFDTPNASTGPGKQVVASQN